MLFMWPFNGKEMRRSCYLQFYLNNLTTIWIYKNSDCIYFHLFLNSRLEKNAKTTKNCLFYFIMSIILDARGKLSPYVLHKDVDSSQISFCDEANDHIYNFQNMYTLQLCFFFYLICLKWHYIRMVHTLFHQKHNF